MTAEQWTLVKSVFSKALDLDPAIRERWVSEQSELPSVVSEEVRRLIEADRAGSTFAFNTIRPGESSDRQAGRLPAGEVLLGRFEIIEHLGTGAMGDVYSAFDRQLKEIIAFKTLRQHLVPLEELVLGLAREVQLARRVRHPNVCQLFDFHQDPSHASGRLVFFTMELLPGRTLDQLIAEGPLPFDTALELATGLAAGLTAIHSAGLIHRDLKPGNVFLLTAADSTATRSVIADFGLCFDQNRPVTETMAMFGPQAVIGTPAYMAPEQLLGKGATQSSDIYAFGVILFEMITGRRPFDGETPLAVALNRLNHKAPAARSYRREVPVEWEQTILSCLEPEPGKRPPSAGAVVEQLTAKQSPARRLINRRELWAVAAGGIAIGAVAKYYPRRHIPDANAEYHFKLGVEYCRQAVPESIRNGIVEFKQAVALDPLYGEAWANLADAYCMASTYSALKPIEARKLAESAAERALSLDQSIARAHAAYAYALSADFKRWRKAEPFFKQAIQLDANDSSARSWYAGFLGRMSRFDEAVAMAESALRLDPGSFRLSYRMGTELLRARQFERGLAHLQGVVRLHPAEVSGFCLMARAYEWLKRFAEAEATLHEAEQLPNKQDFLNFWATLRAAEGRIGEARDFTDKIHTSWMAEKTETNVLLYALGALAMALGETALRGDIVTALQEGIRREDETVLAAAANPYLQVAKNDPDVIAILKQLGL